MTSARAAAARLPAALVLLAAALPALAACGGPSGRQQAAQPASSTGEERPAPPVSVDDDEASSPHVDLFPATLYFADAAGRLRPETRGLPPEPTHGEQARRVVEALLEGPREGLTPVLPAGAGLRALYLGEEGTAYVDLDAGFARGLSGGSQDALVAVRALAITLAANFPEVRRVKILVEGEELRELGGHLDLSRPVAPDIGPGDE